MEQLLLTAVSCIDNTIKSFRDIPFKELHRSRDVTNALIATVNSYTTKKNIVNYLKKDDIVHCTVFSIARSYVNVNIKTDDDRNYGSIHISKLAKKWIEDIHSEVNIGDIFQARIISDDFYESRYG
jgi:exosome complex RNA-binding protein Csl4